MKEVNLPDELLSKRYIEVWNKVDLIRNEQKAEFEERVSKAADQSEYPTLLMSCKTGFNKDLFLSKVGEMAASLKGKQQYTLSYQAWEHSERVAWLIKNA